MYSFDAILVILKEKNLTQRNLSDYLGVSEQAVGSWKSGRNNAWKKRLPEIAAFLGVTVDQLIGTSTVGAIPFTLQQKKIIELLTRLDETDLIRIEGMITLMLTDDKYKKGVQQDA